MIRGFLKTLRPHQWIKNGFVIAPLVFARELFEVEYLLKVLAAFLLFSMASSTVYIVNDLTDVEADRAHPVKRNRPIASGKLPVGVARVAAVVMAVGVLGGGFFLNMPFGLTVVAYLVQNFAYTLWLKRVPYLDVMSIALGFELRVLAGSFAAEVPASVYLLVVTGMLALFLGFGKRLHELLQADRAHEQRKVLQQYDERTLSALLYVTGTATVVTYVFYTLDPTTRSQFHTDYLAITSLMPAFGVVRFMHLVRHAKESESPTEAMLRDPPFVLNLVAWVVAVVAVIYVAHT